VLTVDGLKIPVNRATVGTVYEAVLSKKISREAHPIRAAERRQIVATAVGRGYRWLGWWAPKARKNLTPLRGSCGRITKPRPSAVA